MQRSVASTVCVRIGALIQQIKGQFRVAAVGGDDEGTRPNGRSVVCVGASVDQIPSGIEISVSRGEEQRAVSTLRDVGHTGRIEAGSAGMNTPWALGGSNSDVSAEIQQRFNDGRLTFGNRPHHGGLSAGVFGRVDRGSMFYEEPYCIG